MLPTKFRFIWQSGFREENFFESPYQKQKLPMAAMFVNGSGQNEQSLERTFHKCFLPSFTSFGWGVSEEKIKMWKVNRRRSPSDGKSSHCLWQGELKRSCDTCFADIYSQWRMWGPNMVSLGCMHNGKTKSQKMTLVTQLLPPPSPGKQYLCLVFRDYRCRRH
jgi:hypothetical protein